MLTPYFLLQVPGWLEMLSWASPVEDWRVRLNLVSFYTQPSDLLVYQFVCKQEKAPQTCAHWSMEFHHLFVWKWQIFSLYQPLEGSTCLLSILGISMDISGKADCSRWKFTKSGFMHEWFNSMLGWTRRPWWSIEIYILTIIHQQTTFSSICLTGV